MKNHQYSEDEVVIKKVITQMTESFNKMASVFTIDGDLVNAYGTRLSSRSTIETRLVGMIKCNVPTAALKTVDVEVRFIRPDVAIAHVTNALSDQANPGEQPIPASRAQYPCIREGNRRLASCGLSQPDKNGA